MAASSSVATVEIGFLEPLLDDGLPLVDLEAQPVHSEGPMPGVRPFAHKFQTTHEDDPRFASMIGFDITFCGPIGHVHFDDI